MVVLLAAGTGTGTGTGTGRAVAAAAGAALLLAAAAAAAAATAWLASPRVRVEMARLGRLVADGDLETRVAVAELRRLEQRARDIRADVRALVDSGTAGDSPVREAPGFPLRVRHAEAKLEAILHDVDAVRGDAAVVARRKALVGFVHESLALVDSCLPERVPESSQLGSG